jgi:hypothetical protein
MRVGMKWLAQTVFKLVFYSPLVNLFNDLVDQPAVGPL